MKRDNRSAKAGLSLNPSKHSDLSRLKAHSLVKSSIVFDGSIEPFHPDRPPLSDSFFDDEPLDSSSRFLIRTWVDEAERRIRQFALINFSVGKSQCKKRVAHAPSESATTTCLSPTASWAFIAKLFRTFRKKNRKTVPPLSIPNIQPRETYEIDY